MATSNNEWLQIYNNNLLGPSQQQQQPSVLRWSDDEVVAHATTVTTTTTGSSSVSNQLGRVARPSNIRRRSRVSRRAPTTLLNTDTTNFRAMVQQFTGGGGAGTGAGGSNTFMTAPVTVAPRQTLSSWNNNSANLDYYGTGSRISPVVGGGYNADFRQPLEQQYYTMVADNGGGSGGGDHQHGFVQRVQEGGIFSGDNNNNDGKNNTNMF